MLHRCELGISGFLAMDLFALLARDTERRMRLPSGSGFMARQTRDVLQSCALAGVIVSLTKPQSMEPYRRGFGRLSEISIEQWFGFLRTQHASAQMSARSFFASSARQMMKENRMLVRQKAPKSEGDAPLTSKEPLAITSRFITCYIFVPFYFQYKMDRFLLGIYKICLDMFRYI